MKFSNACINIQLLLGGLLKNTLVTLIIIKFMYGMKNELYILNHSLLIHFPYESKVLTFIKIIFKSIKNH